MNSIKCNQYLRYIELCREKIQSFSTYPYCLPVIKDLSVLEFHPKVTYIVGENGTGKSTLLEAIAVAYGFNPEGGTRNFNFSTKDTHSDLHKNLKLVKGVKAAQDGFFLRAESFYNVATNIDEIDACYSYGGSLHLQSHGESFLSVIRNRFSGNGLYILDESEAALSPSRQMSMLVIMDELIKKDSQFIIATHSPIIMSYPDSIIYELKDNAIKQVTYKETEHYKITRTFLDKPEKMLEILLAEE